MTALFKWNTELLRVGQGHVTIANIAVAMLFAVVIWWLAALMERAALRMAKRYRDEPSTNARVHLLSRMCRYSVWVFGTLIGLNWLGFDLSSFALIGGAIGIGLGFGLQGVISNFTSGVIILLERSLKVGDFVDLASGVRGHVLDIAMRYTRISTNDAIDVLVPNSEFINGRVTNWTLDDALRRMHIPFGVAYGTPKELVREACQAAAARIQGVVNARGKEPDAWLISYGDSAVNFELVFWADRELTTHPASCHARMMWALDDELAARGIEIPFPQRDINFRSGVVQVRLAKATEQEPGEPGSEHL